MSTLNSVSEISANKSNNVMVSEKRYVLIEENIQYDWDDYDLWANIYFDLQENEFVVSKFGHGVGCPYINNSVSDLTLINRDEFNKAIAKRFGFDNFYLDETSDYLFMPCVVNQGRKFRGNLTLVRYEHKKNLYRSRYKSVYDTYAIVWDKQKNQMCRINPCYIEFDKDYLNGLFIEAINKASIKELTHLIAYSISYSSCDSKNLSYNIKSIVMEYLRSINDGKETEIENVPNIDDEREKRNHEEKCKKRIAKELPNITEWAKKTLPNGTEEEIQELIQKVINKHYK